MTDINIQKKDMLPLFSDKEGKGRFMENCKLRPQKKTEDILHMICFYDRTWELSWGVNENFGSLHPD